MNAFMQLKKVEGIKLFQCKSFYNCLKFDSVFIKATDKKHQKERIKKLPH